MIKPFPSVPRIKPIWVTIEVDQLSMQISITGMTDDQSKLPEHRARSKCKNVQQFDITSKNLAKDIFNWFLSLGNSRQLSAEAVRRIGAGIVESLERNEQQ